MNQKTLIQKIRLKAKQDEKNRSDPRFMDTMGFLMAKGLFGTNLNIRSLPNKRLSIDDVLWAGHNVEPRILEVLPAAVLRLGKHFDFDPKRHVELAKALEQMRKGEESGDDFFDIPYAKIKIWAELPLRDKRVKKLTQKKVVKTFRLLPSGCEKLRLMAQKTGSSETAVLEQLLLNLG